MSNKISRDLRLLWRGLFLEADAYDEAAESDNPIVEGLYLVVMVGVIVGLAALVGGVLDWATTPNMTQMKDTILDGMRNMPWFDMIRNNPQALQAFEQQYNFGWNIGDFLTPKPTNAISSFFTALIGLIVSWLWFGLVAQLFAHLLGGKGSTRQTLGASALAVAPSLLNVFGFLPGLTVAAVGTWTLLARYIAIRRVHDNLTWGRVLVATLAPGVVIGILVILLGLLLIPMMGALIGGFAR